MEDDNWTFYDDASMHHGSLQKGMPTETAATHIAMFTVWTWFENLASADSLEFYGDVVEAGRQRLSTPRALLDRRRDLLALDLTSNDLSDEGVCFANDYYLKDQEINLEAGGFIHDWMTEFAEFGDIFAVPDTWEAFDRIAPIMSGRLRQWRNAASKK